MIPYLDKTIVKIGLGITILGLLIGAYKWHHDSIFEAGRNSMKAELADEYKEREKNLTARLQAAQEEAKRHKKRAADIQISLDRKAAENRRLRDEINNATFDCDDIGGDFMDLWNKTIVKPTF